MVQRSFLVSLLFLANPWLFEVEVQAQKDQSRPTPCSQLGVINVTKTSERNETCGTLVNYTNILVCENDGWREMCDEDFNKLDARVICRQLGNSTVGAGAGRLSQGVGAFASNFFPLCNGQESSITDCAHMDRSGACNSNKIFVTCFIDDPASGPSCRNSSTGSPSTPTPTATPSGVSTDTSVSRPFLTSTSTGSNDPTNLGSSTPGTSIRAPSSGGQGPLSSTTIIAIAAAVGGILVPLLVVITVLIFALLVCKRSSRRKQNFNDQVSPDSPVKVRNNTDPAERYKDLASEPGMYSELNNSTVIQHQVPVYDTVKNKSQSQNLSEVSASDSNEDVDNHTYSALDPDAIYTQIPPHLGLGPGNSKTLPVGLKDVPPSQLYQQLDRSLSLPRTTGASNSASATPGYMLPHAVNRTALALESGNISETDLASPRSVSSIKYPSPHGSPKQHHSSSSQSSTSKEELPLIRNPTNAQMENYYHVLDQGAPTVVAAANAISATANSDIDSQVSTDAVCNQHFMDDRHQPHCHSPRRQRQRIGAAGEMMGVPAEGGADQHFYATLEPSVRAQLTPPSRHDTRQRSQSTLNNRSPPQQQRMRSNSSKGDVHVNYSGQRVVNNFSPTSYQPNATAEVTNTLV